MPRATEYRLIWYADQETYKLCKHPDEQGLPITPGEQKWFAWLETVPSFSFVGRRGQFTARREARQWGEGYWYAYLRAGKKLRKKYVGKTDEVTLARLEQVAALLTGQEPVEDTTDSTLSRAQAPGAAALSSLEETPDGQQSTVPVVTSQSRPRQLAQRSLSGRDLPAGTTTLLFTDIEGSTRLLQQLGKQYAEVLPACRQLLRTVFQQHHGHEVDTQGDAFFVVFARSTDAISAAVAAQRALLNHVWPEGVAVRVRMGLHTGEPQLLSEGYVGLDVHQAARIASAGHGGQVLLSQTTRELVEHVLPEGVSVRDLGEYHLKDLQHPIHLYQLVIEGLTADFPPLKAVRSNKKDDALLVTRLHVPRPRAQLVARTRLVERLHQSTKHALTLVSAPAGFGKTTLLSQWLAESGTPVAWLSLEPADNEPVRFLTYLTAALQTLNSSLGVNILELLEASQSTPLESALIVLTNEITNRQLDDFVLVIDDYHIITNAAIHRAIAFLIDHLPPRLHLVLATRADPPLPLARLRVRGQLVELRTTDMRMLSAEVNTFLDTVMGLDLPSEAISALESRTEGWAAGLQLAALSLQGRRDVSTFLAAFTGSHRFVLDYLSEEVLARQEAPVLSFLLQTSILARLSGPLCDAVTAQGGGQAMLEALEQANLFTSALDDRRHWYRYHHLFAEVLRNRLQQTHPLLVPELHRRASLWYEQYEHPIEAVSHALAAGDVERAARLVEQYSVAIVAQGQTRTVLEWLHALPDTLVRTRPLLAVYHASALHLIDQVEESEARLHDAERAISSETPPEQARNVRGIIANVSGNIARYTGDLARYVSLGQQAFDLIPESNLMLRAAPAMQVAHAYLLDGDVTSTMEEKVRRAVTLASRADYPLVYFRSLTMLARLQVLQGRLRDAALTYEEAGRAVPGTQVLQVLSASAVYCFGLADLFREWNRLDEAEHLLAQGMELVRGKQSSFADDLLLGYLTQARLQCARGAYSDALATLDTFLHLADTRHFVPWLKSTAEAVRIEIALAMGNLAEALRWVEESELSPNDVAVPYTREREYLTLARVTIAMGREGMGNTFEDALHVLERLLHEAEAKARMSSVLGILLLQALALHAQGERQRAFTVLERTLTLAAPQGYVRLFVDEGTPVQALLRQYHPARHSGLQAYVAMLLSAFDGQAAPASSSPGSLLEPLTGREREVLRLLLQGSSNSEIARHLVLSINTVKRHIYNICGKLGVESRTQAVVKARDLNLL